MDVPKERIKAEELLYGGSRPFFQFHTKLRVLRVDIHKTFYANS